ncbi:MAG: Uma2 family endonuclease [Bryobacterales bacterium]|nr:Uma2 family endonuclease [Bryobacterales bacterium]
MGAVENRLVTVEEYLSDPAYEHCEYVDGEVVELNMGTDSHSRITIKCGRWLDEYLDRNPGGSVHAELHCRLTIGGKTRYRLPDVCLVRGSFEGPYIERAPDLCVEIRSPKDSVGDQIAKFDDYFVNGCKLGWLILPEEQTVLILAPASGPRVARIGDTLDGGEVLPGLQIAVASLFA